MAHPSSATLAPCRRSLWAWQAPSVAGELSLEPASTNAAPRPSDRSRIGARGIGQLIAVGIDFDEVAEWILAIDHSVGFFARIKFLDRHTLLAAMGNDALDHAFDVRILHAKMRGTASTPILPLPIAQPGAVELEQFNTDLVAGR